MGAWGTGPFDNDGAGDFLHDVGGKEHPDPAGVRAALEAVLESPKREAHYKYEAGRAAARLVADDKAGDGSMRDLAKRALERMKDDEGWIQTWDEPKLARSRLSNEIGLVTKTGDRGLERAHAAQDRETRADRMEKAMAKRNDIGPGREIEDLDEGEGGGEDEDEDVEGEEVEGKEAEEAKPKITGGFPAKPRSHHRKGGDLLAWVKRNQVPLLIGTGVALLFWFGRSKRGGSGSEYVGQLRFNVPSLPFLPSVTFSPQGDYRYGQQPYGQASYYRPHPRRRYFPATPYRTPGILPAWEQQYQAQQPAQPQYQQPQYQQVQQPVTYTPYPMPQSVARRTKAPAAPVRRTPDEGVRAVQWALNTYFGSQLLNEDGIMGDTTANLVRDFQGQAGLPQTGVVDRVTHDALSKGVVQRQAAQKEQQSQQQQQPQMYAQADERPDSWTQWTSQWSDDQGAVQQPETPFPATLDEWRRLHGEA
jgi:peptidoglycan hydrolase-like protein with peptidoglycan-binding domain